MQRPEPGETVLCATCAAEITPNRDRGYLFEPEGALCWRCAIDQGGVYDEQHGRWTTPPQTADVPRRED